MLVHAIHTNSDTVYVKSHAMGDKTHTKVLGDFSLPVVLQKFIALQRPEELITKFRKPLLLESSKFSEFLGTSWKPRHSPPQGSANWCKVHLWNVGFEPKSSVLRWPNPGTAAASPSSERRLPNVPRIPETGGGNRAQITAETDGTDGTINSYGNLSDKTRNLMKHWRSLECSEKMQRLLKLNKFSLKMAISKSELIFENSCGTPILSFCCLEYFNVFHDISTQTNSK
jgi:hypothetical protein